MPLAEKRAKLAQLHEQSEIILYSAAEQKRELTDEEQIEVDRLINEFEKTNSEVRLLERVEQAGDYLRGSAGRVTNPDQPAPTDPDEAAAPPVARNDLDIRNLTGPNSRRPSALPGRGNPVQRFMAELRSGGGNTTHGFRSFGEFLQSVASDRADRRLTAFQAANEGVGAQGGYLMPTAFATDLLGGALVTSEILARCALYPMPAPELRIAGANQLDHSNGRVAGVQLQWVGEGDIINAQDPKIRGVTLYAHKAGCLIDVTSELLEDAATAEKELTRIMTDALRLGLEHAILNGSGNGQPRGVLKSPALIAVGKETGQAADTFRFENAVKMIGRLHPSVMSNAIFIANPSCLAQIIGMSAPVRSVDNTSIIGGSVLESTLDARAAPNIAGIPTMFTECLPLLGDVGDVVLIAPSEIALGIRRQMTIAVDTSGKFDRDMVRFRLTCRMDATPKWSSPVTPMSGGDTLSPFVALEAR